VNPVDLALADGDLADPSRLRTPVSDRRDALVAQRGSLGHQADHAGPYPPDFEKRRFLPPEDR